MNLYDLHLNIKFYIISTLNSNNYIIFSLLILIFALIIVTANLIIRRIKLKETIQLTKKLIIMSYKRLDEKAKTKLISRLQMANETELKIKFNFLEKIDLRLIERSNIRSYIPFLNVYTLLFIIIVLFFILLIPIHNLFNSWKTAVVVSAFISLIPTVLLDTLTVYNIRKTRKATANFLSLLLSWLEVKNDLVFAFEKIINDVEAPLKFYLIGAVTQLKSGVESEKVFDILSYKINTEQFYTITKNFKSVFKNGGNIIELVKVLEDEAYMIDNEFENRVTDTFITRILLNILLLGALFFLVGSVLIDPTLKELYTNTISGKNVMFVATVIFIIGFIWNLKFSSQEY